MIWAWEKFYNLQARPDIMLGLTLIQTDWHLLLLKNPEKGNFNKNLMTRKGRITKHAFSLILTTLFVWFQAKDSIQKRNTESCMAAEFATESSLDRVTWLSTSARIQERSHIVVRSVINRSPGIIPWNRTKWRTTRRPWTPYIKNLIRQYVNSLGRSQQVTQSKVDMFPKKNWIRLLVILLVKIFKMICELGIPNFDSI